MSGVVVILNGYPGVGKTSVAKELAKQLTNARIVQLHQLEHAAASVHSADSKAQNALVQDLTSTLLDSLRPDTSNPIYLIPQTILASSPDRNKITPFLQLGARGFLVVHIVLSSSTDVNVSRLLAGASTFPSAGAGEPGEGGRTMDEASLLELRMEEEVLRLMGGIIGRRASASGSAASASGTGSGSGSAAGSRKGSAIGTTDITKPQASSPVTENSIENLEQYLSAEYEIDTSRLDAGLTGMMAAEYIMDVMRKNGVLMGGGAKAKR